MRENGGASRCCHFYVDPFLKTASRRWCPVRAPRGKISETRGVNSKKDIMPCGSLPECRSKETHDVSSSQMRRSCCSLRERVGWRSAKTIRVSTYTESIDRGNTLHLVQHLGTMDQMCDEVNMGAP